LRKIHSIESNLCKQQEKIEKIHKEKYRSRQSIDEGFKKCKYRCISSNNSLKVEERPYTNLQLPKISSRQKRGKAVFMTKSNDRSIESPEKYDFKKLQRESFEHMKRYKDIVTVPSMNIPNLAN
jgi:hypothetical protein